MHDMSTEKTVKQLADSGDTAEASVAASIGGFLSTPSVISSDPGDRKRTDEDESPEVKVLRDMLTELLSKDIKSLLQNFRSSCSQQLARLKARRSAGEDPGEIRWISVNSNIPAALPADFKSLLGIDHVQSALGQASKDIDLEGLSEPSDLLTRLYDEPTRRHLLWQSIREAGELQRDIDRVSLMILTEARKRSLAWKFATKADMDSWVEDEVFKIQSHEEYRKMISERNDQIAPLKFYADSVPETLSGYDIDGLTASFVTKVLPERPSALDSGELSELHTLSRRETAPDDSTDLDEDSSARHGLDEDEHEKFVKLYWRARFSGQGGSLTTSRLRVL